MATTYLGLYVVPQIYVYTFIPLFSIGYNLNHRPMDSKVLNCMENLNEFFILMNGYFMTVFTQWICDPAFRYKLGDIYLPFKLTILIINLILIIFDIGLAFFKEFKRRNYTKKLKENKSYFEERLEVI